MLVYLFGTNETSLADFLPKSMINDVIPNAIKQAETIWKYIVSTAKEAIVLKTPIVLAGNIVSNLALNVMFGQSPFKAIKYYDIAIREAIEYRNLKRELTELQVIKKITRKEEYRIKAIEDRMSQLSSIDLINKGMLTSIISDIQQYDQITQAIDKQKAKLPKALQTAVNYALLTKETKVYQFMKEATLLSDFAARYAMYQFMMEGKKRTFYKIHNRLPKKDELEQDEKEVLGIVLDAFINYELPDSSGLDFANKMGFVMFTKYFLRIQKILQYLVKEKPLAITAALASRALIGSNVASVLDNIPTYKDVGYLIALDGIIDQAVRPHILRFVP
jgi:hypothetical protein